ncbi:MAG TPA: LamG-like jellyroll fold domain-containing protein [Pseudoxanthomonas sp.]
MMQRFGAVSAGGGSSDYAGLIMAEAPVLWLKLDETSGAVAHDSSGNGRDCAVANCTYDAAGIIFSSLASTISRTDPALRIGGDNSWCVSAIVSRKAGGGSVSRNLATYWEDEGWGTANFRLSLTSGDAPYVVYEATNGTDVGAVGSSAPAVDTPILIHALRRPSGMYLYINGALVNANTTYPTLPAVTGSQKFAMGGGTYPSSYGFLGTIRHLVLYDHELSAAKILEHAEAAGFA